MKLRVISATVASVWTAPFGRPVVPELYASQAGSCGSCASAAPTASRVRSVPIARPSSAGSRRDRAGRVQHACGQRRERGVLRPVGREQDHRRRGLVGDRHELAPPLRREVDDGRAAEPCGKRRHDELDRVRQGDHDGAPGRRLRAPRGRPATARAASSSSPARPRALQPRRDDASRGASEQRRPTRAASRRSRRAVLSAGAARGRSARSSQRDARRLQRRRGVERDALRVDHPEREVVDPGVGEFAQLPTQSSGGPCTQYLSIQARSPCHSAMKGRGSPARAPRRRRHPC